MCKRSDITYFYEQGYRNIAIYGLSVETQKVLPDFLNLYNVVGLLDGYVQEGIMYGVNIISLQQCKDLDVDLIVVIARPGSCRAIVNRIRDFCISNNIALMNMQGSNLLEGKRVVYDFSEIEGISRKQLTDKIDCYDSVSFDLFDTLITRKIMHSSDVIELVDARLREKGIIIQDFVSKRLAAEKSLSRDRAPKLKEIYDKVLQDVAINNINAEWLAEFEWKLDYDLIVPRDDMIDVFCYAAKLGKKIYIITDTYYNLEQIKSILNKAGVNLYTDVLVSCELGVSKTQGLFDLFKEKFEIQNGIHIGDDILADVEHAQKVGLSAIHIYNAYDMLEKLGYLGFDTNIQSLSDKIKLGLFISKLFNSPFQFEQDNKLSIRDSYDIGYLLMAPIISDFVIWFHQKIKENNIKSVWFGARDGFLIKKLYDMLENVSESVYFLCSRTAAVRSFMDSREDIDYIDDMKFSGRLSEQLYERFGINVSEEETLNKSLYDFEEMIFESSKLNRENYKKYISHLIIPDEIAFFDFVAKGTVQMYLGQMVTQHIKGFYFMQLEKDYMDEKSLDVVSFYGDEEENNSVFENYYILETILTSHEPSLAGFDSNGTAYYAKETRTRENIETVLSIQQGIIDYFKSYIEICSDNVTMINKRMDERMLNLIHKFNFDCEDFAKLVVEDPFFNRYTKITELF